VILESLIGAKRILVVMGSGGVGKTTLAATLGLQAAVQGRRALVLTIDPAMRLADALGLGALSAGDHHRLPEDALARSGVPARRPLSVAMLDTGRSLTALITREVSDPKRRRRILETPFFDRLCQDLAGSREYAAMEELHHLHLRSAYDLLIVDTPPTTHGLDFLEAPDRVLDVLEHDSYRWLMRPALLAGRLGLRVLDFSGGYVVRTLSKFTGIQFLKDLAAFIDLFSGSMEGFRQRAAALRSILTTDASAFLLVTTPDPSRSEECRYLNRRLSRRHLAPGAVIANRVTPSPAPLPREPGWRQKLTEALAAETGGRSAESMVAAMQRAHRMLSDLAERDRRRLAKLKESLPKQTRIVEVPLLEEDVHDIAGLEKMRRAVFTRGENHEDL
jgi:anion-transporting  ArsA/GET3 family ATPase